jgi:hypothetical protein
VTGTSGIYTGAIYSDPTLKRAGFLGESRTGNEVIAVKSHFDRTPPVMPAKGSLLHAKYKKVPCVLVIVALCNVIHRDLVGYSSFT